MIREFSVRAKASNGKARALFIICMVSAFALISASMLSPLYKGVIGLVGVVLLAVAITLYTKYVVAEYFYDVTIDNDGRPLLVVRRVVGNKQSTLCRIGLYEVMKIEGESAKEMREHKTPTDTKKYLYLPTLLPDRVYRLTTSTKYERAEIVIEVSEEFASLLSACVKEARELYFENDE